MNHVEITPEGKAVVGQSLRLFEEADELLFAGFGDDEVEALAALLSRAKENLERDEARQREPDGGNEGCGCRTGVRTPAELSFVTV